MKSTKVIITALAALFFVNVSYMEARAETSSSAEVAEGTYQEVPPLQIAQFETQIETAPPAPPLEASPASAVDVGEEEAADGPGTETLTASEEPEEAAGETSIGEQVVAYASQFIGNPYVYGGTSLTKGADCSGFVMRVYEQFGVSLPEPRRSRERQELMQEDWKMPIRAIWYPTKGISESMTGRISWSMPAIRKTGSRFRR